MVANTRFDLISFVFFSFWQETINLLFSIFYWNRLELQINWFYVCLNIE